jgi:hypothetical protein
MPKLSEKLSYLQKNHFSEWLSTKEKVKNELSDRQSIFCVCRKLATGLHESSCKKFSDLVIKETVKRLIHL